jgi:hypothetical protein
LEPEAEEVGAQVEAEGLMAGTRGVMSPGSTKRPRQWPERRDTPPKFRAGVAGPHCPCCRARALGGRRAKQIRRHIMRRREKAALRKEIA